MHQPIITDEQAKRLISQLTKGSKFGINQERRNAALQATANSYVKKKLFYESRPELKNHYLAKGTTIINQLLNKYSLKSDIIWQGPCFVHIDLDMFYCAVELLNKPHLIGRPVAVGGSDMICTSNYEARRYGIKAGIPGFIATRLCPDLILIPTHFDQYRAKSAIFMEIMRQIDQNMISRGLDEVSLDVTSAVQDLKSAEIEKFVDQIRAQVKEATGGLTCSAGVASTRILAKIQSNVNKPDGLKTLWWTDSISYLESLPIKKIHGIGSSTSTVLNALGLDICSDIWKHPDIILSLYPPKTAQNILVLACGHSVEYCEKGRQSLGCERSFNPTNSLSKIMVRLHKICDHLSRSMKKINAHGKKLTVKIRNEEFTTKSRCQTLPQPIASSDLTLVAALESLRNLLKQNFNLIVSVTRLKSMADNFVLPMPNSEESDVDEEINTNNPDDIIDRFDSETREDFHPDDIVLNGKVRLLGLQFSDLIFNYDEKKQTEVITKFISHPISKCAEPGAILGEAAVEVGVNTSSGKSPGAILGEAAVEVGVNTASGKSPEALLGEAAVEVGVNTASGGPEAVNFITIDDDTTPPHQKTRDVSAKKRKANHTLDGYFRKKIRHEHPLIIDINSD